MSDNASGNILQAISKLDSSMAKMVEQDPDRLQELYGAIRLQIENLEAKVSPMVEDRMEADEDHFYWSKLEEAEQFYDNNKPLSPSDLRKYMAMRLEAIYKLLSRKGIYQVVTDYGSDDLEVIQPREMEDGDN